MKHPTADDVMNWWRIGSFLYSNVKVEGDFLYGEGVAKKIAWRFYWLISTKQQRGFMSTKTMHLVISTNNKGSECDTDLDITPDDWDKLTSKEQQELITEALPDIANAFVTPK